MVSDKNPQIEVISVDADIDSADWSKQTWDLPPYKSAKFCMIFPDLENFRLLPVYKYAVEQGRIVNDEWVPKLSTQQIGKLGELLVQYQLLKLGIETAHLTTDAGIDLVAYSKESAAPKTIQVKTNLQAKRAGGKGALALDWTFPEFSAAEIIALVDISKNRVWMFSLAQAIRCAQQNKNGNVHSTCISILRRKSKTTMPLIRTNMTNSCSKTAFVPSFEHAPVLLKKFHVSRMIDFFDDTVHLDAPDTNRRVSRERLRLLSKPR